MGYHYEFLLPLEREYDPVSPMQWMQNNWHHSFTLSAIYICLIFAGQSMMRSRPAFQLRIMLILWNTFLAIFSTLGFLRFAPDFLYTLFLNGFHHSICFTTTDYENSVTAFWIEAFAFSKAFELIDTLFIVLRKRPLIFLHYYHHVTVLMVTWHSIKEYTAAGRWFITVNFFIHSIMYTYYALRAAGCHPPRVVALCITSSQIVQMLIGIFVAIRTYLIVRAGDQYCQQTMTNLYFCFFIYITFFSLFLHYFFSTYIWKSSPKFGKSIDKIRKDDQQQLAAVKNGHIANKKQKGSGLTDLFLKIHPSGDFRERLNVNVG